MSVTSDFETSIQNSDCLDTKTRWHCRYNGCTIVSTIRCSIPGRGNRFSSSQKRPDRLCRPPSLLLSGAILFFALQGKVMTSAVLSPTSSVEVKNEWTP